MFYLIGGAPRAGKTTIAGQLAKELGIPWISTDTLESVVSQYVPEETFPHLFPKSIIRRGTNFSNDAMYERHSTGEIKTAYFKQAQSLAEALETFIESEFQYEHEYVIEGYHILPELILELSKKYPVRSVFVGREDLMVTQKAIIGSTQKNDWVVSKTENEETFPKIAEMLVSFSRDVKAEAEKRQLHYITVGDDFAKSVEQVVHYLRAS